MSSLRTVRLGPNRPSMHDIHLAMDNSETHSIGLGHPKEPLRQISKEINHAVRLRTKTDTSRGCKTDIPPELLQISAPQSDPQG